MKLGLEWIKLVFLFNVKGTWPYRNDEQAIRYLLMHNKFPFLLSASPCRWSVLRNVSRSITGAAANDV